MALSRELRASTGRHFLVRPPIQPGNNSSQSSSLSSSLSSSRILAKILAFSSWRLHSTGHYDDQSRQHSRAPTCAGACRLGREGECALCSHTVSSGELSPKCGGGDLRMFFDETRSSAAYPA